MTTKQHEAMERVRAKAARLEHMAATYRESGSPREAAERAQSAADLLTLLALLDEQREALEPFQQAWLAVEFPECVSAREWRAVLNFVSIQDFRRAAALTGDQP